VQDPQVEVGLAREQCARSFGFVLAQRRQIDVLPTSEEVEIVPFGLTMAKENKVRHVSSVVSPGIPPKFKFSPEFQRSGRKTVRTIRIIIYFLDKERLKSVSLVL
jgi:hypothetical protein